MIMMNDLRKRQRIEYEMKNILNFDRFNMNRIPMHENFPDLCKNNYAEILALLMV